ALVAERWGRRQRAVLAPPHRNRARRAPGLRPALARRQDGLARGTGRPQPGARRESRARLPGHDTETTGERQRAAHDAEPALLYGRQERLHREIRLDERERGSELLVEMTIGRAEQRQAQRGGELDGRPVEVDARRVEVTELDRVEQVDLLPQLLAKTVG